MKIKKNKWEEMSYNRYLTHNSVLDRLNEENHFNNSIINNILEYRDFEEDDYSEESFP